MKKSILLSLIFLTSVAQAEVTSLAGLNLKIVGGRIQANCSLAHPERCEPSKGISILPEYRKQTLEALTKTVPLDLDLYNYDLYKTFRNGLQKTVVIDMDNSNPQPIAYGQESTAIQYHPSMGMNLIFTNNTYIEEHRMFGTVERMEVKCTAKSDTINITNRLQYVKNTEVLCIFPNNLGFLKFAID